ncbi:MAG TPA: tRNA pseudouridine(55) synthase TruB [Oculatellaceae cyanobacterium]
MLGFLNVYKPSGVTSHDVVKRVRKTLSLKQIGHGGTLDPLAEGVLPIAIGPACRLLRFLAHDKVYVAEILLGEKRDTDDVEGKVLERCSEDFVAPSRETIEAALKPFVGEIKQRPPLYSAIHHDGKRLYELARAGETPEIAERLVEVVAIEIINYIYPVLKTRIFCGGGTYIRSIARDLGEQLGCFGCLKSLVREKSGPFQIEEAVSLEEYKDKFSLGQKIEAPTRALANNPNSLVIEVSPEQSRALRMGQKIVCHNLENREQAKSDAATILAVCNQEVIAICKLDADEQIKPEVVIAHAG